MINVSLKPYYGSHFLNNRCFYLNSGNNILFGLKDRLIKRGIEINTYDLVVDSVPDFYIYFDTPQPWQYKLWLDLIRHKQKNILFCLESPLVNPFNQMKFLFRFFNKIYTWNTNYVDEKKVFKVNIPQLSNDLSVNSVSFEKKKFLTLISSNKNVPSIYNWLSPYRKNYYLERDKAIKFFDKNIPNDFYLYGWGWNKPRPFSLSDKLFGRKKYVTYRGEIPADKKIRYLSRFKFNICYENASAPGYITEKIFDSFKAKSVPVYIGDPNIDTIINSDCYIDKRDFKTYNDLLDFLTNISEKDYYNYIRKIEKFVKNKVIINSWFEDYFDTLLVQSLN